MLIELIAAFQMAAAPVDLPAREVFHGRQSQTTVAVPRIAAEIEVDGALSEPVWAGAALLTGFSQYRPVDGQPAPDSTEILLWYSATALHVGIRAFEPHGAPNATLADRDQIFEDDNVRLFIDTFDDQRRAFFFAVNPLGVQGDGVYSEGTGGGGMFSGEARESGSIDLNPDMIFASKGHVTDYGYEVELQIPFKSIRFPSDETQTWSFNVMREVQHLGQHHTWTAALRAATSFLAQSGKLEGMTGLERGLVLDLNPVATQQVRGAPDQAGDWRYDNNNPELGLNARWGITNNLTANATVNPDFSQVEADVAQIAFDPRQAIFFPEKRPFFLESNEQFSTMNGLIYTRRIVDPVVAAKLAGKVSGTEVGVLTAVDEQAMSRSGGHNPLYNLLRVRRDIGAQSAVGLTFTQRLEGPIGSSNAPGYSNHVGALDARLVLDDAHTLTLQAAASADTRTGSTIWAPLWMARADRSGREFGWNASVTGISPDFIPGSGFMSRTGVVYNSMGPRWTFFGPEGSRIVSFSTAPAFNNTWVYDRFAGGNLRPDELKLHLNNTLVLRGGWNLGASLLLENFLLPKDLYEDYAIEVIDPADGLDTIPFVGRPSINNYDLVLTLNTPQFPKFNAGGFVLLGRDENYPEWAPGWLLWAEMGATWRPTADLRINPSYNETRVRRTSDWSEVQLTQVQRLKVEYQIARPLFVRVVGQYVTRTQDDLRDDGRTDAPILIRDRATGIYSRDAALGSWSDSFRADWLVSYQPTPGTVIFAGYGSSSSALSDSPLGHKYLRFDHMDRVNDGFFLKLSYLFRV